MKKKLSIKQWIGYSAVLLFIGFIFYSVPFILFVLWSEKVNQYCNDQAVRILKEKGVKDIAKTVKANNAEKEQFPGMTEISLVFREQLKCEHDPKVLEKFRSWWY